MRGQRGLKCNFLEVRSYQVCALSSSNKVILLNSGSFMAILLVGLKALVKEDRYPCTELETGVLSVCPVLWSLPPNIICYC